MELEPEEMFRWVTSISFLNPEQRARLARRMSARLALLQQLSASTHPPSEPSPCRRERPRHRRL